MAIKRTVIAGRVLIGISAGLVALAGFHVVPVPYAEHPPGWGWVMLGGVALCIVGWSMTLWAADDRC